MSIPVLPRRAALLLVILSRAVPAAAQADDPLRDARARVQACAAAAEAGRGTAARAASLVAEGALRARLREAPRDVEAHVLLARALSQCRLPFEELMTQGELSAEAVRLLRAALAIEPGHWTARFALAMNHFRAPRFLDRSDAAAREFDELLRLQGDRADDPRLAEPWVYRGLLHVRAGRPDSARALWARGAALFPADRRLAVLLATPPDALRDSTGESAQRPAPDTASSPEALAAARLRRVVRPADETRPTAVQEMPELVAHAAPLPVVRVERERTVTRPLVLQTPGGTADVLQALLAQPGATRTGDASDIVTQGGDPAETPVLLDGGRLLASGRYESLDGSLFGILDPQVVARARLWSGGFSARWGNALSGVVEVETDGAPVASAWRAGANTSGAGATVRVPIGAGAGAWGSARVSHAGALLAMHGRGAEFVRDPRAFDATASATLATPGGAVLRATTIVEASDAARLVSAGGHRGGFASATRSGTLVLDGTARLPAARATLRANVTAAARESDWAFGVLDRTRRDRTLAFRADAAALDAPVAWRAGVEATAFDARERGTVPDGPSLQPGAPAHALDGGVRGTAHLGAYGEVELPLAASLRLSVGGRVDRLPGERTVTVDPRAGLALREGRWVLRAGAGRFGQGRWRVGGERPVAGAPGGLAREAWHVTAGAEYAGDVTLRAEGYVKRYGRFVPTTGGVNARAGRTVGVDVLVQPRATAAFTGWVTWSWLASRLELDDGATVPGAFDATHTLTASATRTWGAAWATGATLRLATGLPYTPVTGVRTDAATGVSEPVYGPMHSARLPGYARLDVRATRYVRANGVLVAAYVEALNVLDRRNVSRYGWDPATGAAEPVETFFARRTLVAGAELRFR